MPRRLSLKDTSTIYYAYRLGFNARNQEVFGDVNEVVALVSDRSGNVSDSRMGTETSYDLQFIVNEDDDTAKINEYTRVWVKMSPRTSDDKPDYEIVAKPKSRNGQILVSCRSTATNSSEFYYEYNGEVLRFMAVDDLENSKFLVPKNTYLPIDFDTKVWYDYPEDIDSTDYMLEIEGIGEDDGYIVYTVNVK